ncbi:Ig-like domain-containing protein [Dysgonomonas sp. Marseille-P4361]|uniref:Ig-like domain-containing protein n=1 Tax=Dysgonomonas sp. Marseille-P4361 TaxID=2161820 RepID=UPI00135708E6|nr:Ig-like domain-containing protein [Dysgonomonas sp. Marseille-P4361]
MKYLKYLYIIILTVMIGCDDFDPLVTTDKPYVNYTSINLYIGEGAGDRNSLQVEFSPTNATYTWESQDPSIVTVDQNGLVKAVKEGFTTITVASKDDKTTIDVTVKEYIPLTGFTLSTNVVIGSWQALNKVFLTPIPENATMTDVEWTTSNNEVAMVYSNGVIKTLAAGSATVTVKGGGKEEQITVLVPEKMSKEEWSIPGYDANSNEGTIGYSSQQRSDGGGVPSIIDEDLSTYWHASYGSPNSNYPHWFIIDLGRETTIAQVSMSRRKDDNRGQKGYQIYTCKESNATDLNDPTKWVWEDQGEFSFNPKINGSQMQALNNFPRARYIKVYIAEKFKGENNYAMVGDFSVYNAD